MQIVIDIPEQRYRSLQECAVAVTDDIHKVVLNGKPYEECKTGKWIFGETMGHSWMKCSECCKSQDGQTLCFNYCPSCGAKMEVDE